ncbi:DUF5590 domain-containing protein [Aneurinibacillus thermoaerophilus]|jgi:uncharacterized protein YpmB|uniref:DUF5590 domain-containing protein n=1 Tax=Aneurinibacillus thermoaerophilus TaxID=143495 RepID=A0A1G8BUP2_ANETH|nr:MULTISPECIES: DUF5590 domain-containing protein [Aneurinibacillus]AMA73533.1 hypothetical protein ACH33_12155 [Aneurinibacillus sp. XH2]MED0674921.1 DUF5590 domain-containing protein [Aneurinibacillus thermoaerophilus]MED0679679.1 DUF5590 domain-containing protein [Aneurinibacillus thermoaerophilus]MED0756172.1 DUF5590 domain-containing protein [Aneurinibacillus thermoaerophilus]MED0760393.1 DUF5590 domain-containing protein [Aneurinibacillus thermoaerophilus]
MKKFWLYGLFVLLVAALCVATFIYLHLRGQQHAIIERGTELALTRTQINEVTSVDVYYGTEDYIVVRGKTQTGEKLVAWFQGEQGEVEKMSRLIPEENVIEALTKQYPNFQLIHIIPAKQGKQKMWEVLFEDGDNSLNYYYIDMYTGKFLKVYRVPIAEGDF